MLRNMIFGNGGRHRLRVATFLFAVSSAVFLMFTFGTPAFAQGLSGAQENVERTAQAAGVGTSNDLLTIIGNIINVVLGLLGVILLILILYAGFLWMTAGGDDTKIVTAKKILKNAVIGLLIIAAAFAIVRFIFQWIGGNGGGGGLYGGGTPGGGFAVSAGSLGGGIIESHYPSRNATGVPRNAAIMVTFKRPVQINSIVQDYNDAGTPDDLSDDTVTEGINDTAVRVFPTSEGTDRRLTSAQVRVRFTADRRTFVFRPVEYLGSATENVGYTVQLMPGLEGVRLEDGSAAFSGSFGNGYEWSFETGTIVDVTPPRLISAFPRQGTRADRNVIISMLFSEALDPTAASGATADAFSNIATLASGNPVQGAYAISNEYRSVEFIPSEPCGQNSCGEDMYCLPEGGPEMEVVVRSATLDGEGPGAQFLAAGYDGIVDMAGNSMDGNADGVAQGRGLDDAAWRFGLTNDINLDTPVIEATVPPASVDDPGRSNVDPYEPVRVRFDSLLQSSSFNTDTATITPHESAQYADTFWRSVGQEYLTDANDPVESGEDIPAKSEGFIRHRTYASSTLYDPYLFSGIRNVYQNCFHPARSSECLGSPNCCLNRPSDRECQF